MASSSCIVTATTTHSTTTSPSLFKPSSLRLSSSFTAPFVGGSVSSEFSGHKLRPLSLTTSSRPKRSVVTMIGSPPDLPSYFLSNRIVYLGMAFVPALAELILAEFLYLQYSDEEKPIYLYINSTGTTKAGTEWGYETSTFAIFDSMRYVKPPIYTLCVGNAWGEAALLLAAGEKGNRAALPSSAIMIKQPIAEVEGQATDVELSRKEMTIMKTQMAMLLSRCTGKSLEEIEADIRRPKYFSPSEAIEYGIIDKVIYNERSPMDRELLRT